MVTKKNKKVSSAFIKMGYIYNKEYVGSFQYDPIEGKQQRKGQGCKRGGSQGNRKDSGTCGA